MAVDGEQPDLPSNPARAHSERSENGENFSAARRRRESLGVERIRVAADEEVVEHQHGHAHEAVLVDEVTRHGGVIGRGAPGLETHDLAARLDQEPARASRDGEGAGAIDRCVVDEPALVVDPASREELSRVGARRSAVTVVENRARHLGAP